MKLINYSDNWDSLVEVPAGRFALDLTRDQIAFINCDLDFRKHQLIGFYDDRIPEIEELFSKLEVSFFDHSSGIAGLAEVGAFGSTRKLKLNIYYFHDAACQKHMMEQTLPHELAHLVAYHLFRKLDHGPSWRYIMHTIFTVPPERLHNMGRLTPEKKEQIRAAMFTNSLADL